jgi:hypothetical protein
MFTVLLIILVIAALGGGGWGYSRYGIGGGIGPIGVVVLVFLGLWLTGNLRG